MAADSLAVGSSLYEITVALELQKAVPALVITPVFAGTLWWVGGTPKTRWDISSASGHC
jgi:hypothetical protein